jgi:hypothetical protein
MAGTEDSYCINPLLPNDTLVCLKPLNALIQVVVYITILLIKLVLFMPHVPLTDVAVICDRGSSVSRPISQLLTVTQQMLLLALHCICPSNTTYI